MSQENTAEFSASIRSASAELAEAGNADPTLLQRPEYASIAPGLARLERQAVPLDRIVVTGSRIKKDYWLPATFMLAGAFLLTIIAVVALVAFRHGAGKPEAAKRWLRVYLEPITAGFAIILGLIVALNPGLDHATSLWGAGIAGSGLGFWIKMAS